MAALTAEGVGKLTVPLLRAELEKRGLDAKGLKAALVARLVEALAGGDGVRRAQRCGNSCLAHVQRQRQACGQTLTAPRNPRTRAQPRRSLTRPGPWTTRPPRRRSR